MSTPNILIKKLDKITDKSIIRYSVIIPTHHRDKGALRAMASVMRQNYSRDKFEILVVANPHSDYLKSEIAKFEKQDFQCQYLTSKTGVNIAKNTAVRVARGEVIVFLDDDCEWASVTHFQQLDEAFKNPNVHGVGGFYSDPLTQNTRLVSAFNLMSNLWLRQFVHFDGSAGQLLGGHSSYRRECFRMGLFNEHLRCGGDETEFNFRLTTYGYRLQLDAHLTVRHSAYGGWREFYKRAVSHGRNKSPTSGDARVTWPLVEMVKACTSQPVPFFLAGGYWGLQQAAFFWQNRGTIRQ